MIELLDALFAPHELSLSVYGGPDSFLARERGVVVACSMKRRLFAC